jgi:probable addiction module antidote protein
MELELEPFEPADYVRNAEEAALFLNDAIASGDPAVVAAALGTIARARGAAAIAKGAGVSRAAVYNGLTPTGNPTLATFLAVTKELGLELAAAPAGR